MLKKILVPIDPAALESAKQSLKFANELLDSDGEITVLSVVELIPQYALGELPPDFFINSKKSIGDTLQRFLKKQGVVERIEIVDGHAAQAIVDFSEKNQFELIVIASHKPEMLDYLLGSTATYVVRKAKCGVLVVR